MDSTETSNAIRRLPMITSGADFADFNIIKKSAFDVFIVRCNHRDLRNLRIKILDFIGTQDQCNKEYSCEET